MDEARIEENEKVTEIAVQLSNEMQAQGRPNAQERTDLDAWWEFVCETTQELQHRMFKAGVTRETTQRATTVHCQALTASLQNINPELVKRYLHVLHLVTLVAMTMQESSSLCQICLQERSSAEEARKFLNEVHLPGLREAFDNATNEVEWSPKLVQAIRDDGVIEKFLRNEARLMNDFIDFTFKEGVYA